MSVVIKGIVILKLGLFSMIKFINSRSTENPLAVANGQFVSLNQTWASINFWVAAYAGVHIPTLVHSVVCDTPTNGHMNGSKNRIKEILKKIRV